MKRLSSVLFIVIAHVVCASGAITPTSTTILKQNLSTIYYNSVRHTTSSPNTSSLGSQIPGVSSLQSSTSLKQTMPVKQNLSQQYSHGTSTTLAPTTNNVSLTTSNSLSKLSRMVSILTTTAASRHITLGYKSSSDKNNNSSKTIPSTTTTTAWPITSTLTTTDSSTSVLSTTTMTNIGRTSTQQTFPQQLVVTKNTNCVNTGGCCTKALSQFPRQIAFEENQTPGTILVPIFGVEAVTFHLAVVDPPELRGFIEDHFNVSSIGNKFMFQIVKYIDLEDLYLKSNKNDRVSSFQLQITCINDIPRSVPVPPLTINMTILDVDDTMPVFQDISGHDQCVVPVYTANTSETFVGDLTIHPTNIRAVDGDLTQSNNISYSIMHAEPLDYDLFFALNITDGRVTKTKTMNSSNPTKYVLFVEATEDSPDQQSRVAILSIKIVLSEVIYEDIHKVNPIAKLVLEITSVVVIAGFISGLIILICHRRRVKERKVDVDDEIRDYKVQTIDVYESSCSSLSTNEPDVPTIVSPSTITVAPAKPSLSPYAATVRNKKFIRRERSPLDTALRPAWNAPKPKNKPVKYNPYSKKKK